MTFRAPLGTEELKFHEDFIAVSGVQAPEAKLEASESENARLLNELQATENALEYPKTEVANLWRAMTTRNIRQTQIEYPSPPVDHTVVLDFAQERHRIQGKIADVRSLARRRKWPWPQTG